MNLEEARARMLGQQLRTWDVFDDRILGVIGRTQRERFVPAPYHDLAFADMEIPLAHDQRIMAPKVEGRLLQSLALRPEDAVLEVGTGSGFLTACLAKLTDTVLSIDIFPEFTAEAEKKLDHADFSNVELKTEDAFDMTAAAQFDAIAVTGSLPGFDDHFIRMLRPGGRLFIIVGRAPVMEALLITLHDDGNWTRESLFETVVPPLINASQPETFVL